MILYEETHSLRLGETEHAMIRALMFTARPVRWAVNQGVRPVISWFTHPYDDYARIYRIEGELTPEQQTEFILRFT